MRIPNKLSDKCLRQGKDRILPIPTRKLENWGNCEECGYDPSHNRNCAGYVSMESERKPEVLEQIYRRERVQA